MAAYNVHPVLLHATSAFFFLFLFLGGALCQLGDSNYYADSCPNVESTVRSSLRGIFARDITAPAAMIRLLFHDCQVDGCDASILLDHGSDGTAEMESPANLGIRRLNIIDTLKSNVERQCPNTVSCADLIAMAARDAVVLNGGPEISIPLGRLDGTDASSSDATAALPPATISVTDMINLFGAMGMNLEESVSVLGSHTVGVAHCSNFANRLYPLPDPDLGLLFAATLRGRCPVGAPVNLVARLDTTFLRFDNSYFKNALNHKGLLTIDSELALDPRTSPVMQNFARDQDAFFNAFSPALVKLSSFRVRTGTAGEVRSDCRVVNS